MSVWVPAGRAGPKVTVTGLRQSRGHFVKNRPSEKDNRLPQRPSIDTGTIGDSTFSSSHSSPRLKPRSWPVREMPPSQKIPTTSPSARPD